MTSDQDEAVRFLRSGAAFSGGATAEVIETHGAFVFLSGDEALKMKRAVKYPYLDFSTLEKREAMLRRELELNRPFAPQTYRDVVPITRGADGGLVLGGSGAAVEWVLRMRRFAAEDELEAIAGRGAFTDELAEALGHSVALYHRQAEIRRADGAGLIGAILDELAEAFADMHSDLGTERAARFADAAADAFADLSPQLAKRAQAGHVRRCHGDLHLRNIVLIEGRPVPFDALEFDETLGTCDVLYDLAFLVMDLQHRGLRRAANIVLNAYLQAVDGAEDAGLATLPLFLAIRAAIRAMVDVQGDRAREAPGRSDADARAYIEDACAALAPPPPRLVAVGGLSGTGKTSLARRIAPAVGAAPGAIHLRSDVERKALAGVAPAERLPPASYGPEAGRHVYARLLDRAERILAADHAVIIDATFLSLADREAAEALAARLGVPFAGLWLEAPPATLLARVTARTGDASDADADVVRQQLARDTGEIRWDRVVAGTSLAEAEDAAQAILLR